MDGFREYGKHLGYPDCCIDEFIECFSDISKLMAREERKLNGTGYVPCRQCNEKSEEELIAAIESNRVCEIPFPDVSILYYTLEVENDS